MSDKLRNEARVLAIMAMQSDRYSDDMDFRDQVDTVYALVESSIPPSDAAQPKEIADHLRELANQPGPHYLAVGDYDRKVLRDAADRIDAHPATDAAQPVAWTWTTVDRVTGSKRRHTSFDTPYRDAYTKDVRALVYAHPEDAPNYSSGPRDSDHVYKDGVLQSEDAPPQAGPDATHRWPPDKPRRELDGD